MWYVLNPPSSGVVVFPYLRQKVERMFLIAREEVADSQGGKYQKVKKIFVQLYPYLHLLLDSLDICNKNTGLLHFAQNIYCQVSY